MQHKSPLTIPVMDGALCALPVPVPYVTLVSGVAGSNVPAWQANTMADEWMLSAEQSKSLRAFIEHLKDLPRPA